MESFCSECKKPDIFCKGMCQACYSKMYRNNYKKKVQKAKAYKRPYFLYKENELVDVCFLKKEINGNYDFITRDINKIPSVIKWDKIQTKEAEKYAAKIKKYTEQKELDRLERLEIERKESEIERYKQDSLAEIIESHLKKIKSMIIHLNENPIYKKGFGYLGYLNNDKHLTFCYYGEGFTTISLDQNNKPIIKVLNNFVPKYEIELLETQKIINDIPKIYFSYINTPIYKNGWYLLFGEKQIIPAFYNKKTKKFYGNFSGVPFYLTKPVYFFE